MPSSFREEAKPSPRESRVEIAALKAEIAFLRSNAAAESVFITPEL
jgi:hypothetical protein